VTEETLLAAQSTEGGRLADKQAKPCLLACLLVLAVSKQQVWREVYRAARRSSYRAYKASRASKTPNSYANYFQESRKKTTTRGCFLTRGRHRVGRGASRGQNFTVAQSLRPQKYLAY